jgi:hypothetical protein
MPKYEVTVRFVVEGATESEAEIVVTAALENMLSSGGDIISYATDDVDELD